MTTFDANGLPVEFLRLPELINATSREQKLVSGFMRGALLDNWQLSVDYFDLEIENTIGDLEATVTCFDRANTENLFCDSFTRDPNNFNVIQLVETKLNRGGQRTTGFDTQLKYISELPAAAIAGTDASFSANLVWTHPRVNNVNELSLGIAPRCAGRFGFPCNAELLIPEFLGGPAPDLAITDIGSVSYPDLGVGYQFSEQLHERLNISNLLDRDAPLMADAVTSNNTDTRVYDIFGRSYSLRLSMRY